MRRTASLSESRLVHMAVGASILAAPASAAALGDSTPELQAWLKSRKLAYGHDLLITGRAPSAAAGQRMVLQFAAGRSGAWRSIASAPVQSNGSFRLRAPLSRSGSARVIQGSQSSSSTPLAFAAAIGGSPATPAERVTVQAALRVRARSLNVGGGQQVSVRGRLLSALRRRQVLLQTWRADRWVTLAATRTGALGGFALRYAPGDVGRQQLRVHFRGDQANAAASQRAGELTVYQPSLASWYYDGGTTACGFHAYYGVANPSLPCGARVSFMSGGRTVNAVVDDRGPYVGGRQWDLNQNTAAALGFAGVGTVWSSS